MDRVALIIILLANITGFAMIGLDKWRARSGRWRISEVALIIPSLIGGWIGTLLAMKAFRHKTQKRTFQLKLGLAIAVSLGMAYSWFKTP